MPHAGNFSVILWTRAFFQRGSWFTDAQLRPVDLVVLTRLNFMELCSETTHFFLSPASAEQEASRNSRTLTLCEPRQ